MKFIHLQILLVSIVMFLMNCTASKVEVDLKGYQEETAKIGYEVVEDSANMIKRANLDLIVLSFFEEFNDIVEVYFNKKKIADWNINKENKAYISTGYSANDIAIDHVKKGDVITIRLVSQKKYIKFTLQSEYPLYTIQRYGGIWYVNLRKQILILK